MEKIILNSNSENNTLELGQLLGKTLVSGVTILLYGGLGVGKTALVRGMGQALGARVKSPSFTLINEYHTENFLIVHTDLYRLESSETEDIGLDEYYNIPCVLLIEWPERLLNINSRWDNILNVFIEAPSENERVFEICSVGEIACSVFQELKQLVYKNRNV